MGHFHLYVLHGCVLQYFNEKKEQEARLAFTRQQFSSNRDYVLEYNFDKTGANLGKDKSLKTFFAKPTAKRRKALDQRIYSLYLRNAALNKYKATLYLFDARKKALYNPDTTSYSTLVTDRNESEVTKSSLLYYKDGLHDRHYYLAYLSVYEDSGGRSPGYLIIDLDLKKQSTETVSLELLQPTTNKTNNSSPEYSYAIYVNGRLGTQTSGYPYTTYLKNDAQPQDYKFYENDGASELHYKISDNRIAVVVYEHGYAIEMMTLFSYLFVIQVLLAAIILAYQLYLSLFLPIVPTGKIVKFTLRRRVHFSMLAVVFISFVIIGCVTIYFFTNQYRTSNADKLQSKMQVAKQSIQGLLLQRGECPMIDRILILSRSPSPHGSRST